MKLNLKNQEILLVESFNVHNSTTKILSDMLFSNDSPEQYYQKKSPEKSDNKTFKEIKIFD